jgi:acetyl esterase/lipase
MHKRELIYKTTEQGLLALHIFEPAARGPDPLPAFIIFFGGGWVHGEPEQYFSHCEYFAGRGMIAIAADYRTEQRHGTSPVECAMDGRSALRYLRAHAAGLGIDPARIVAAGSSAGGHVAAATAFLDAINDPADDPCIDPHPAALVLLNPVVDTTEGGFGVDRVGRPGVVLSPAHHVRAGAPPTAIFHGTADETVPFENVARFARLLAAVGSPCRLVRFEGAGHAFHRQPPAYDEVIAGIDRFLVAQGIMEQRVAMDP